MAWIVVWIGLWLALGLGGAATQGRSAPNGMLRGVPVEGSLSVDNIFVFVVIFSELLVRPTPAGGTEQAPGRSGVEGKVQRASDHRR